MTIRDMINTILNEQQLSKQKFVPVDIVLKNGNILLRSFRIYELNPKTNKLKGLTYQEEYIHSREERVPSYCIFKLDEIKELYCPLLDLNYTQDAKTNLWESN